MKNNFLVTLVLMVFLLGSFLGSFKVSADSIDDVDELDGKPEVGDIIVTLGSGMSDEQRFSILNKFGVVESEVVIIPVYIEDEREYLGNYVSAEKMGNKSFSSSKIEILEEGSGIEVETSNISWVSEAMYTNALITAGVKDAKVTVTAPMNVSGTGALTGIIKAYDSYSDIVLDKEHIDIANEEMVTGSELSDEIGSEEADALLVAVKELIIDNEYDNKEDLRKDISEKADDLGIVLKEESLNRLSDLYFKMSELDIDWSLVGEQFNKLKDSVIDFVKGIDKDDLKDKAESAKGFFGKVLDFMSSIIDWFRGLLGDNEEVVIE